MELSFIFIIAVVVALFMGLNIGGNNAAASMALHTGQKSGQNTRLFYSLEYFLYLAQ